MACHASTEPMPRISLLAVVRFWGEGLSGAGMLQNISMTGALIWPATTIPACSTDLRLELVTAGGMHMRTGATVIRREGAGFAVALRWFEPQTDQILNTIIQLGIPRLSPRRT
jgi:hypothetical protein